MRTYSIRPSPGCVVKYDDAPGLWILWDKKGSTVCLQDVNDPNKQLERKDYYKCRYVAAGVYKLENK